jgi:alpha,alpha-trehalase
VKQIKKETPTILTQADVADALQHIDGYWKKLLRKTTKDNSTLIDLPYEYIVPSPGNDHFSFEEQYYWDSYFTALGINDEKLVSGMLDNLIDLFERFGLIPNANRFYFTSRSQPPILTTFIFHVYDKYKKNDTWLQQRIAVAKREYHEVWLSHQHPHDRSVYRGLSRYYDINYLHDLAEAESGWDMTPRFKRQCLDYLPIDLNCLLYKYEADFARAAEISENPGEARIWHYASEERKINVTTLMWHKQKNFFFDYNYHEKKRSDVWSLAAYYALWAGLATDEQAAKLVKNIEKFDKKGGLATTAGSFMYTTLFGSTKTQWAYPNGWAPLHYIVIEGLSNYGYKTQAKAVAHKWLKTCNDWYLYHGEFQEKYNVVNQKLRPTEGVYPSQTGFGWTNGVFVYLCDNYIDTTRPLF